MVISMQQLLNFSEVYNQLKTVEFSINVAYQLSCLNLSIKPQLEFYYNHMRALAQEYAERDASGQPVYWQENEIQISKERANECLQKTQDLIKLQVEIPDVYFKLSDFGEIKLTPEQLEALIPFVKNEEQVK